MTLTPPTAFNTTDRLDARQQAIVPVAALAAAGNIAELRASRELATVGMLSALPGAEAQLQAHMRISMNIGLTSGQLRQLIHVLSTRVDADAARRASEALDRQLGTP